jgi:hypothetical protein
MVKAPANRRTFIVQLTPDVSSVLKILQHDPKTRHRSKQFTLLSRISGDAPRATKISAGRLDSSRAGLFQTSEAALLSISNQTLRSQPFRRSHSVSQLLFVPRGER